MSFRSAMPSARNEGLHHPWRYMLRPEHFAYSTYSPDLIDRNIQLSTHLILDGIKSGPPKKVTRPNKGYTSDRKKDMCFEALLWLLCEHLHSDKESQMNLFMVLHRNFVEMEFLEPPDSQDQLMESVHQNFTELIGSMVRLCVKMSSPTQENKNVLLCVRNEFERLTLSESHYVSCFEQLKHLGKGGQGSVYKVLNRLDKRECAVKKIRLSSDDPVNFNKIKREVDVFSRLKNPNIVEYISSWVERDIALDSCGSSISSESDSSSNLTNNSDEVISKRSGAIRSVAPVYSAILFIQMELCSTTLHDWIANRNQNIDFNADRFSVIIEKECDHIFRQILTGVEYIHSQKLIHRDLTPSNIFINNNMVVKIGDFGLARTKWRGALDDFASSPCTDLVCGNDNLTAGVGTMTYSAPEQKAGGNYNQKADMYSLGLITFELFYPFGTQMEKNCLWASLKTLHGLEKETKVLSCKWPVQMDIVRGLLQLNPALRPSAASLLKKVCKNADKTRVERAVAKKFKYIKFLRKKLSAKDSIIRKQSAKIKRMKIMLAHFGVTMQPRNPRILTNL